jgi:hypothetical protein
MAAAREHRPPDDQAEQRKRTQSFQQNDPHDDRLPGRQAPGESHSRNACRGAARRSRRLFQHATGPAGSGTGRQGRACPTGGSSTRGGRAVSKPRRDHAASARPLDRRRVERTAGMDDRSPERGLARAHAQLRTSSPGLGRDLRRGAARRIGLARQRRGSACMARRASAAVARRVARRRSDRPRDRLLRAADRSLAHFAAGLSHCPARTARRPRDTKALLDAPSARHAARRAQVACRQRDCLGSRPARCPAAAGAGLGPPGLHRRARQDAHAGSRRLRGAQRPAVQVGRPLARRSRRAKARPGVVAGNPGLGATKPEARRRAALEQPARRLLSRRAAARSGGRAERRARRCADAGPLDRRRPAKHSLRRCAASSSPRTPAPPSSARFAPTISGAGATTPKPRPGG